MSAGTAAAVSDPAEDAAGVRAAGPVAVAEPEHLPVEQARVPKHAAHARARGVAQGGQGAEAAAEEHPAIGVPQSLEPGQLRGGRAPRRPERQEVGHLRLETEVPIRPPSVHEIEPEQEDDEHCRGAQHAQQEHDLPPAPQEGGMHVLNQRVRPHHRCTSPRL